LVEFNGDGKDDLVNVYGNSAGKARAWVHLSTGSGFAYQSSLQTLAGFSHSQRWLVGDVNLAWVLFAGFHARSAIGRGACNVRRPFDL